MPVQSLIDNSMGFNDATDALVFLLIHKTSGRSFILLEGNDESGSPIIQRFHFLSQSDADALYEPTTKISEAVLPEPETPSEKIAPIAKFASAITSSHSKGCVIAEKSKKNDLFNPEHFYYQANCIALDKKAELEAHIAHDQKYPPLYSASNTGLGQNGSTWARTTLSKIGIEVNLKARRTFTYTIGSKTKTVETTDLGC